MSVPAVATLAVKAVTPPLTGQAVAKQVANGAGKYIIGDSFGRSLGAVAATTIPAGMAGGLAGVLTGGLSMLATVTKTVDPVVGVFGIGASWLVGIGTKIATLPFFFKNFGTKFLTKA